MQLEIEIDSKKHAEQVFSPFTMKSQEIYISLAP